MTMIEHRCWRGVLSGVLLIAAPPVFAANPGPEETPGSRVRITRAERFEIGSVAVTATGFTGKVLIHPGGIATLESETGGEPIGFPWPGRHMEGRLVASDADVVILVPDGRSEPVRIPQQAIDRVDVLSEAPRAAPGVRIRITGADVFEVAGLVRIDGAGTVTRGTPLADDGETFGIPAAEARNGPSDEVLTLLRPGVRLTGRLVAMDLETLTVRLDGRKDPVRVPRGDVARIEVGTPRSRGKGALKGAAIGFAAGAILGFATGQCSDGEWCIVGPEAVALALGVLAAPIGAAIGYAGGPESWSEVPMERVRVTVAPARGRGLGVAVALSF